ncbi:hypothetical protein EVAR_49879_1 [Eumeta japonica]|uniref:DUF7869 domain-containing protein n=1 Tax=Eumeta variegata TaxID=151549 RepID=A0A4C1XWR8_EUMVA|nr:hypothetical protein EVAR_49879_1 [Eumeta japonica]
MLQEDTPGLLIVSFDCEKNLPLPKIPDQTTYYSRQLYYYNFTIVMGTSRSTLTPDNIHAYVWMEDEASKGSNEICSALYHCLNSIDLTDVNKIRLISDGCGGQNKNSIVVSMIMKWLHETTSNIKNIELIFPVTGHSFLPADRVFALNERVIRKRENIIDPKEYKTIIEEHATVHQLATKVTVYDWKGKCKEFLKNTNSWHFQISKCKRLVLKKKGNKINVRGEVSYINDICQSKSLLKRGKRLVEMTLNSIPVGVPIKAAKQKDVNNLLTKHYGADWMHLEELKYYKNVLTRDNNDITNSDGESVVDPGNIENEEVLDFV